MTSTKRLLIWIALPLLLAIGGFVFWKQDKGNAPQESYLTDKVKKGDIEDTVSALGALQPFEYVDVGTQVTGQLKSLHVAIGQQVRQGELVAEIDPTLLLARVEASAAALNNLKAQLSVQMVQQRLAQQQYARNKELYTSQAVSEDILQQSQAAADQAAAQIEALKAQIQQTQSQLRGEEANLRYTKIYAPMTGTVVSLTARQGQTLVASQQVPIILRIADMRTMTVWAQVSEADVPKINLQMPVYFSTLGLPERRWYGAVRQVLPTPESVNNVILYNVLFDVDNPDQALKPQMSAQTSFIVAKAENTLVVPASALRAVPKQRKDEGKDESSDKADKVKKNGDKGEKANEVASSQAKPVPKPEGRLYTVRVLKQGGQVEERQVTIGVMSRTKAQVLSGLSEDEDVIIGTAEEAGKQKSKSKGQPNPGKV